MEAITLMPDGNRPLYEQLYRALAAEISSGSVREGERMPSKRALAGELHLSLSTVETAYSMLAAEGYLCSRPRSGYFACAAEAPVLPAPEAPCPARKPAEKPKLLQFSTGAVDLQSFPYTAWARITRSVVCEDRSLLLRGEAQGDWALRAALSRSLYEMRGVRCEPDQIIIGAGIEYLLDLIVQLFGEDQIYGLENPGYFKTAEIMANHRSKVRLIEVDEQGMNVSALTASGAKAAYVTPSHQFPLGVTMPVGRRMQLLRWADEQNGYLIEDDYDSEFRYETRPIPALQGFDRSGRVLYLGTFSRSIAPSIRAAYLILPRRLLPACREKFRVYSSTVSRIEQQTLARFIDGGHFARHLRRMTLLYKKKREYLLRLLKTSAFGGRMTVRGENAGLHFLLTLHLNLTETELIERARAGGVLLHGISEYCTGPASVPASTVILGYAGLSAEEMEDGVSRLECAWTE